jgi:hypothetical protein
MPLVEDVISQLGKSAWFTTLDLQSGFWQIRMAPEDMGKTALVTKSGLFEWTVMSFGLKNATSTFARTMTKVFKDLGNSFLKIFVDDLNVHSVEWQAHLQHLEAVLSRLREVNLKLNLTLFALTKKDVDFIWSEDCQRAFDALKRTLIGAPILVRPNFRESFFLDVDWSTKGVGAILSQKEGRLERVIVATLAFGLRPRQGGCEVAGLEVDPGVTSHAPESAKSAENVRE